MLLLFLLPFQANRHRFEPGVLRQGLFVFRHRFFQLGDMLLEAATLLGMKQPDKPKRRSKKKGKQTLPGHFGLLRNSVAETGI